MRVSGDGALSCSVSLLKLEPPLIPPRGEVNAADAFDIGSFDEDDTKKIKVKFQGTLCQIAVHIM